MGPKSPFLLFFFSFLIILANIVFINGILVHSTIVRKYMIEHYTVFKLRGYNSTTTPIRHLGTLGCYPWF